MRTSTTIIAAVFPLISCTTTTYVPTSSSTIAHWQGRDISELVSTIGPFDTTSISRDSRSYDWFRFGHCHLKASTDLNDKIEKIEMEGTVETEGTVKGCSVYATKLGG